jgi:outer membrane protein assembly factor BamE (lipoprotein component of BamABCDE complex)
MNRFSLSPALLSALVLSLAIGGCVTTGGGQSTQASNNATTAPAQTQSKIPPGMNERGEVVDSTKVESGYGKKVKGLGDTEGEITGKPAPKSKFGKLGIGMSMKQVTDLIGQPTDSGAYMTGKAWIPFYFGSDRHRYEMTYKSQGRLIFAGGSIGNFTGGNLIWIIHNANESGYRN